MADHGHGDYSIPRGVEAALSYLAHLLYRSPRPSSLLSLSSSSHTISVPTSLFVSPFRSCKPFKQSINQADLDHQTPVNQPNTSIVVQLVEPTSQKWIQVVCYAKQNERVIGKVDWTTKSNDMRNGSSAGVATRDKGKFFRGLRILDHRGFEDCHCPLGNQNSLNQALYHLQS